MRSTRSKWLRHTDRHITPEMLPEPSVPFESEDLDFIDALSSLPKKHRQVLMLYYYNDLTVPEIADALGCAKSTVSYRLKRGKDELRNELRKRGITDV